MTPVHEDVLILVTGGTLDKIHDAQTESLTFDASGESQLPAVLKQARCGFATVQQLFAIDSLDMSDADRENIALAIDAAAATRIVITHGTGTMGETARFLAKRITGRTVVLTGAMRPHSLGRSDASFNVGGAVIAAQTLPHGVYGVMNGRVFAAQDLHKNQALGRFDA